MKSAEQKNIKKKLKHKHSFNGENDSKKIDGRKGKRATKMCEFCNEVYAKMFLAKHQKVCKKYIKFITKNSFDYECEVCSHKV